MSRPQSRFVLMGAVIAVMAVVNVASFLLVRNAGQTLHAQATPRALAASQLRFDVADMNGAQNLYVLRPVDRGLFLAAERRLRGAIAASSRLAESPTERRMLARIQADYRLFVAIDGRIWADIRAGQTALADELAAGSETSTYQIMAADADRLQRDAVARRIAALDTYNSRQRLALAVVLGLDGIALVLTMVLLAERVRTGRRMDTRDAELETLLAELPAAVRIYDCDRERITYANQEYLTVFGYTRADVDSGAPLGWSDHVHPDDRERVFGGWRAAAAAAEPWVERYRWVGDDGVQRWVSDSERSLPGSPQLRLGIALDVTEQQRSADELDEQRRRYRTLVEQMPMVVYIDDRGRRESQYVSPQLGQVLGISEREWFDALGDAGFWRKHVHPEDRERVLQAMGYGHRDGIAASYDVAFRFLRGDGEYRWIENEEIEVTDEDGCPLWRQGLIRDIHDQTLAEDRYAHLIDRLPGTVALWDRETRSTLYVSAHIEQLTGEPPEHWLGREGFERYVDRVPREDRDNPERWRTDGLPSIYRFQRSDGREIWIREIDAPSPERESALSVLLFDATAEMTAQIAARDAQKRSLDALAALVTAAEDERSRIATELHDDTVSDLTAVLMHVRIQMRRDPSLERFEQVLSEALERTRRLMFELRPHVLAHAGLQAAVEQIVRNSPPEHPWRSEVRIELARQSDVVEALAYRAIRELVMNARKHSRAGLITVRGWEDGGVLRFVVQDDGVGFDPDEVRSRESALLHIGLASTTERLRLAGGDLEVRAARGQGARFTITLPAQPRAASAGAVPLPGEAAAG